MKRHSGRLLLPAPRSLSPRRKRLEGEHNDAGNREADCVRGLAVPAVPIHSQAPRRGLVNVTLTPGALHPSCRRGRCGRCCGPRLFRCHGRSEPGSKAGGRGRNL
jgi:hypothetical protein